MQLFEQRKHKRYKAPYTAFLVDSNTVFRLLDIGTGGLCFRCMESDSFPNEWSAALFIGSTTIHIQDVDLQFIWEKSDKKPSFLSMPTKEVGVAFKDLSHSVKEQMVKLLLQDLLVEV